MMRVFLPAAEGDGVRRRPELSDGGPIEGQFRKILEETGMSIQLEIEMIAHARELDSSPVLRLRHGDGHRIHEGRR